MVKNCLPVQETQETQVQSLGWEDPLEEGTVTHSGILAWRVPWTEKPGRLQSLVTESDTTEHFACFMMFPVWGEKGKRGGRIENLSITGMWYI